MEDLVSVLIPVYNVENYIDKCIESVVNQTYKNIEVILVDDGSKDNSSKICDDYAKKYDCIKVYHKNNEGIGPTRNFCLRMATGKYVLFVDSDDYIDHNMIKILYDNLKHNDSQISSCSHIRVSVGSNKKVDNTDCQITVFDKVEALRVFLLTNYVDVVFWNKLILRDIIPNDLCPNHIYEDVNSMYKILFNSERIVHTNLKLYYYVKRENSITYEDFTNKMFLLKKAVDENYCNISKCYPSISNDINLGVIHWYVVIYDKMILANKIEKEFKKELKQLIRHNRKLIIKTKLINRTRKIQFLLCGYTSVIYMIFYKMYYKKKVKNL